jgi:hypothetical protein
MRTRRGVSLVQAQVAVDAGVGERPDPALPWRARRPITGDVVRLMASASAGPKDDRPPGGRSSRAGRTGPGYFASLFVAQVSQTGSDGEFGSSLRNTSIYIMTTQPRSSTCCTTKTRGTPRPTAVRRWKPGSTKIQTTARLQAVAEITADIRLSERSPSWTHCATD